jgi:hypothetical protein
MSFPSMPLMVPATMSRTVSRAVRGGKTAFIMEAKDHG